MQYGLTYNLRTICVQAFPIRMKSFAKQIDRVGLDLEMKSRALPPGSNSGGLVISDKPATILTG